jgi:hypothetical protein
MKLGRESQHFVDSSVPFYGDDSQYTSAEYMKKYGITPDQLDMIAGTSLNIQDVALMNLLKNHLSNLQQQKSPSMIKTMLNARNSRPTR